MEVKKSTMLEEVCVPFHHHLLIPFTRFIFGRCKVCCSADDEHGYIYGGYRCNEPGCDYIVFHKECAPLPEINHNSHPDHSLKLIVIDWENSFCCTLCASKFKVGYCSSICDFKLDLKCATRPVPPLVVPEYLYGHKHPLELFHEVCESRTVVNSCVACHDVIFNWEYHYRCHQCNFATHVKCVYLDLEAKAFHPSHPQHPLESLEGEIPGYADKKCLLCAEEFDDFLHKYTVELHHCEVCNFSICRGCMKNPPPLGVVNLTTHEHQLHLIPRRMDFTCNACGTLGDRSPYFCLQCNFMIHRQCIDLPRVININRHDHRISYTSRLGHGEWKCKVCRKKVDGFYGAYTCSRCPTFAVHSRCATRNDVWDMIELEGTPEEEELEPFEVIDDNTIKHFSHDHNLRINKDGRILHESIVCEACVLQICTESFYSCEQCDFILHETCANLPRKKRHVSHNQPFTLRSDSRHEASSCFLCYQNFSGFRYESGSWILDVRCGSISDSLVHQSHPHPLYYFKYDAKPCIDCGGSGDFSCDECDFNLDYKCAILPQKVTSNRYHDHPLFLTYGETSVNGEYWCEACETKVNPKKWFYTCNDCGVVLHISCLVGDFSYVMPGTCSVLDSVNKVVSNTSICRPLCSGRWCNSRCKRPTILEISNAGSVVYVCSKQCLMNQSNRNTGHETDQENFEIEMLQSISFSYSDFSFD